MPLKLEQIQVVSAPAGTLHNALRESTTAVGAKALQNTSEFCGSVSSIVPVVKSDAGSRADTLSIRRQFAECTYGTFDIPIRNDTTHLLALNSTRDLATRWANVQHRSTGGQNAVELGRFEKTDSVSILSDQVHVSRRKRLRQALTRLIGEHSY